MTIEPIKIETENVIIECPNCAMGKPAVIIKGSNSHLYGKCAFCNTLFRYHPTLKQTETIVPAEQQHYLSIRLTYEA